MAKDCHTFHSSTSGAGSSKNAPRTASDAKGPFMVGSGASGGPLLAGKLPPKASDAEGPSMRGPRASGRPPLAVKPLDSATGRKNHWPLQTPIKGEGRLKPGLFSSVEVNIVKSEMVGGERLIKDLEAENETLRHQLEVAEERQSYLQKKTKEIRLDLEAKNEQLRHQLVETLQVAEERQSYLDKKEKEVQLLERSIEDLEDTIFTLENKLALANKAARGLANLAAHGDNNDNNAAVGQEAGALEALVQLTSSQNEGVRQEAAGALWNLSFDDRNREAIAAVGGVEALVALVQQCLNASEGLQERAAGALWGLSVSEANSIAIGQGGGVAPLLTLARSEVEDVHETAAGALWNLAFYCGNALRIVEEGGVPVLVKICSSSGSKIARFMSALALAYMFDGRMDEVALVGIGTSSDSTHSSSKSVNVEGARRIAFKHIETFVLTFSDSQMFSMAAASSAPAALSHVAESVFIHEAGHLRCSRSEIGRFVAMLRNPSPILRVCAAFALLQFTIPGGRHAVHHAGLLQEAGAGRVLRAAAAATTASIEAKIFARIVLRNLEHHQSGTST